MRSNYVGCQVIIRIIKNFGLTNRDLNDVHFGTLTGGGVLTPNFKFFDIFNYNNAIYSTGALEDAGTSSGPWNDVVDVTLSKRLQQQVLKLWLCRGLMALHLPGLRERVGQNNTGIPAKTIISKPKLVQPIHLPAVFIGITPIPHPWCMR